CPRIPAKRFSEPPRRRDATPRTGSGTRARAAGELAGNPNPPQNGGCSPSVQLQANRRPSPYIEVGFVWI
uniref:Uncharacterized protein n=1 Tax=Oryza rufipogon TaxID=4529 RepID=A0A0E0P4J2_ORYRU